MIKYNLRCDEDHEFEGWFRDSRDFDDQAAKKLIECPICGSDHVRKAIMAPSITTGKAVNTDRLREIRGDIAKAAARARDYVEKNFDYVGEKFPEEARKIHYGETEERGIYGEASGKEVRELVKEGVEIAPLPGAKTKDKAEAPKVLPQPDKKLN